MHLSTIAEKKGCCPGCGKKFKKDEPYPDVENCEVCERFGPPKDLKESSPYDSLEDTDYFEESFQRPRILPCSEEEFNSADYDTKYQLLSVVNQFTGYPHNYQIIDGYIWPETGYFKVHEGDGYWSAPTFEDEVARWREDPDTYLFPWSRPAGVYNQFFAQQNDDPDTELIESSPYDSLEDTDELYIESSPYDNLEDSDEFDDSSHVDRDPVWQEFDYHFLGTDRGHEFDFRGDTYLITQGVRGRNVFKNGRQIGKSWEEVPWNDFEWHAGQFDPAQRWSWEELVGQLHDFFVDYGDSQAPGVPIYEDYHGLDDDDRFEEEYEDGGYDCAIYGPTKVGPYSFRSYDFFVPGSRAVDHTTITVQNEQHINTLEDLSQPQLLKIREILAEFDIQTLSSELRDEIYDLTIRHNPTPQMVYNVDPWTYDYYTLVESSGYENLDDDDQFQSALGAYYIVVTRGEGSGDLSYDELINGCRETLARQFHGQVGDLLVTQYGTNPNWIAGHIEYNGLLPRGIIDGRGVEIDVH
jgi:hypothetical protein